MKFMQKRRFYVTLCYGMLFFCLLFFSLLLNELNAVISAHLPLLTGTFQSFDKPCLVDFLPSFSPISDQFFIGNYIRRRLSLIHI